MGITHKILELRDCDEIVIAHLMSFNGFFLTNFGNEFLTIFYQEILKNKEYIKIGLFDSNSLVGFAIGSLRAKVSYKEDIFMKNKKRIILILVKQILKKPKLIFEIYNKIFKNNVMLEDENHSGWLLSFCIIPQYENKKLGTIMLKRFEEEFFKSKQKILLTTDFENNDKAVRFYKKNGYIQSQKFNQGNRVMILMKKYDPFFTT